MSILQSAVAKASRRWSLETGGVIGGCTPASEKRRRLAATAKARARSLAVSSGTRTVQVAPGRTESMPPRQRRRKSRPPVHWMKPAERNAIRGRVGCGIVGQPSGDKTALKVALYFDPGRMHVSRVGQEHGMTLVTGVESVTRWYHSA